MNNLMTSELLAFFNEHSPSFVVSLTKLDTFDTLDLDCAISVSTAAACLRLAEQFKLDERTLVTIGFFSEVTEVLLSACENIGDWLDDIEEVPKLSGEARKKLEDVVFAWYNTNVGIVSRHKDSFITTLGQLKAAKEALDWQLYQQNLNLVPEQVLNKQDIPNVLKEA